MSWIGGCAIASHGEERHLGRVSNHAPRTIAVRPIFKTVSKGQPNHTAHRRPGSRHSNASALSVSPTWRATFGNRQILRVAGPFSSIAIKLSGARPCSTQVRRAPLGSDPRGVPIPAAAMGHSRNHEQMEEGVGPTRRPGLTIAIPLHEGLDHGGAILNRQRLPIQRIAPALIHDQLGRRELKRRRSGSVAVISASIRASIVSTSLIPIKGLPVPSSDHGKPSHEAAEWRTSGPRGP